MVKDKKMEMEAMLLKIVFMICMGLLFIKVLLDLLDTTTVIAEDLKAAIPGINAMMNRLLNLEGQKMQWGNKHIFYFIRKDCLSNFKLRNRVLKMKLKLTKKLKIKRIKMHKNKLAFNQFQLNHKHL